jgi:hypothetical protein
MQRPNVKRGYSTNSASSATSAVSNTGSQATTLTGMNATSVRSLSPSGFGHKGLLAPPEESPFAPPSAASAPSVPVFQENAFPLAFPNENTTEYKVYPVIAEKTFTNNTRYLNIALRGDSAENPAEIEISESGKEFHNEDLRQGIFEPRRTRGLSISTYPYKNGLRTLGTNTSPNLKSEINSWLTSVGAPVTGGTRTKKSRKQEGGFYPSVMGGVQNAILLAPAALRLGYSMLSDGPQRSRTAKRGQRRSPRRASTRRQRRRQT